MYKPLALALMCCLLLAGTAAATTYDGSCAIRFFGQSTLHDFDGQAACQPFTLVGEPVAERELFRQPAVRVPVKQMNTANAGRDEKMLAMFESAKHPQILGWFADLDAAALLARWQAGSPGPLGFDLQIRDQRQPVTASVRDLAVTPELITFTLEFPLSLAAYRLEPPSVLGLIKVADQVRVEVKVRLQRR